VSPTNDPHDIPIARSIIFLKIESHIFKFLNKSRGLSFYISK